MKTVRIHVLELTRISHCCSDKVVADMLAAKGIDLSRPFIKYFDFTGRNLIIEQEEGNEQLQDGTRLEDDG